MYTAIQIFYKLFFKWCWRPNSICQTQSLSQMYFCAATLVVCGWVIVARIVGNTTDASQDAFSLLFPFSLVVFGIRCAPLLVLQLLEKLNLWWPACNIIILAVVMIGSKCVTTAQCPRCKLGIALNRTRSDQSQIVGFVVWFTKRFVLMCSSQSKEEKN